MAQVPGAEAFVRMLQLHGVKHMFGLCGDTQLPFYDAMYRLDHGMQHILTRDERSAAYMADGYARVSGRVGVCEGPSGGGATYILPGIVEANESSVPVLCFTSDISVSARGRYALTELDQQALFKPLTKWNTVLDSGADIPARAARIQAADHRQAGRSAYRAYPTTCRSRRWMAPKSGATPGSTITPRGAGADPAAIDEAAGCSPPRGRCSSSAAGS